VWEAWPVVWVEAWELALLGQVAAVEPRPWVTLQVMQDWAHSSLARRDLVPRVLVLVEALLDFVLHQQGAN
jgi:hypothetical protein